MTFLKGVRVRCLDCYLSMSWLLVCTTGSYTPPICSPAFCVWHTYLLDGAEGAFFSFPGWSVVPKLRTTDPGMERRRVSKFDTTLLRSSRDDEQHDEGHQH